MQSKIPLAAEYCQDGSVTSPYTPPHDKLRRVKVIVTGANGSLGLAVARMLVRAGHYVIAFVHNVGEFRRLCREERVGVLEGDILDRASVAAVDRADAVIHCAHFSPRSHDQLWDALRHGLEAVRPGGYFVYPSDARVYELPEGGGRVDPDHPKRLDRREDEVRADLERAVLAEAGTVIHLAEVYGPEVRGGRLVRAFRRALSGRRVRFPGPLDATHEFLHIDDAARALIAPLGRRVSRGRAYTAPGPAPLTAREFLELIYRSSGRGPRVKAASRLWLWLKRSIAPDPRFPAEIVYGTRRLPLLDGARILRELGWLAEVPCTEGVRRTVKWLRQAG